MKTIALIIFLLQLSVISFSQVNLVPNPSFEQFDTCPDNVVQTRYAIPWNGLAGQSPDYFNVCSTNWQVSVPQNYFGYQNARTGQAYAGFSLALALNTASGGREYIQTKLLEELEAGTIYCIKFYVSAGDSENYVSNDIGMYFSQNEIHNNSGPNLPFVPQFENNNSLDSKSGWTEVSGEFTALGGERYIIIGNFKDYYSTILTFSGASPLGVRDFAYYYIDDVSISRCDTNINDTSILEMPNVFSPNGDQKNDKFIPLGENKTLPGTLKIFNRWGQIIFTSDNIYEGWDGGNLPDGVYYWELTYTDLMENNHRNNGYVILLRNE